MDFTKITAIGSNPDTGTTWVKIKYEGGGLSITGVEGPKHNGDARGGCGQIDMHPWSFTAYREGWNADKVARLRQVWKDWHLNDMVPYSPEMKALGWREKAKREILCYKITLTSASRGAREAAEKAALEALRSCQPFTPTAEQSTAVARPVSFDLYAYPEDGEPAIPEGYEREKHTYGPRAEAVKLPERKTLGWIYPKDHPDGLLGRKVNPEDEHGYGGKWWREDVPQDVLDFLQSLPTPTDRPAWI